MSCKIKKQSDIDLTASGDCCKCNMSNIDRHPRCHMRTSLGNCDPLGGFCTSVNEPICEALHKASRSQEWIPCSERLPNKYGKVLVTFIPSAGTLWTKVIIAHYSDLMGIAKPCFWIGSVGHSDFCNITNQVTAWMPLPETYKESRND